MYALKYGNVHDVRATGGLNDTIEQYDHYTMIGNGFKFSAYDSKALFRAIEQAIGLYKDKKAWKKLMLTGMKNDFSWDRSANHYLDLYNSILR